MYVVRLGLRLVAFGHAGNAKRANDNEQRAGM
jgi:hypothetical protein